MMEHTPIVSVIMPAYNAERFIEKAIRSVMAQTMEDWELLVIDDCSTDRTYEIACCIAQEDCRIRVLKNVQNSGVARTRNRGLDLVRGAYVALLDSDDVWYPEKLERQIELGKQTGAQIIYCSYAIVDENGDPVRADYIVPAETSFDDLLKENCIGCSTVLLTHDVLDHRFESDFYHEDYVLWLKLLQKGLRAAGCTTPLVSWRYLENSRSFNKWKAAQYRWNIYRKGFGLPLGKSLRYFAAYAVSGLQKYQRRSGRIGRKGSMDAVTNG